MDGPEAEPALRNHLIMQEEFYCLIIINCGLINDRWEVLRNLILDQNGQLRSMFKASCFSKMLQFWDLWAWIHREENLDNEFHLWGKFVKHIVIALI